MKQDSDIKYKLCITDSKLFKEISSVMGKDAALKELIRAYKGYTPSSLWPDFNWNEELLEAFDWGNTPQGWSYWESVMTHFIEEKS